MKSCATLARTSKSANRPHPFVCTESCERIAIDPTAAAPTTAARYAAAAGARFPSPSMRRTPDASVGCAATAGAESTAIWSENGNGGLAGRHLLVAPQGCGPPAHSDQSVSLQSVSDQSVSLQSVSLQSVSDQSVSLQSVSLQSVSDQSVSLQSVADTALDQPTASNPGPSGPFVTNLSRFACGFGAWLSRAAAAASTSPTPPPKPAAVRCAAFISAPFTWPGVQSGWRASTWAAAPATIGAESDVPDIHM